MEKLTGSVERVTYYNPENGYSVLRLRPQQGMLVDVNREGLVTVVGNLPEVSPGEQLELKGNWEKHSKHGTQFKAEICEQSKPVTLIGIRNYLGSGLIKGIGKRLAENIVDHFGMETLDVIDRSPERLLEVQDIGPKRSRKISQSWQEQRHIKEIMLFLHSYNISTNLAIKIYKTYGSESLVVVKQDPYRLAKDIYGVAFKTADRIARELGLPMEHPSRVEVGITYVLDQMVEQGHVFVPDDNLIQRSSELLQLPQELVIEGLSRLEAAEELHIESLPDESRENGETSRRNIYLPAFHVCEVGLSQSLQSMKDMPNAKLDKLQLPLLDDAPGSLTDEQLLAVRVALQSPVSILTGGPGTGKTTAIRTLINAFDANGARFALASPTGRAAKRLSEAAGKPASTIHRLLGYSPTDGFKYNDHNKLRIDFLVVDEVSMLDLVLAHHLLKAIRPGAHILFVGDVDQLPSVGAGDVLRDMIGSEQFPVTHLTKIFRQDQHSHIISNAHRINHGEQPAITHESSDFFLFAAGNAEDAGSWVEEVVVHRIPAKFGFDPIQDIQVLSPMYRGQAGVDALNLRLQQALNPPESKNPEVNLFGRTYRKGDKVMQIRNNYDKDVFNGDIGFIHDINRIEHTISVDIDGRLVTYDWNEVDELVHAYAVTVHKAQGSEFPVVVLPLVTQHYMMLQRNLLYTGVTRAKNLCVLVGGRKAIAIAVNNNQVAERYSALDLRLRNII